MDLGLKRSVVTQEQLNALLDFMKENPDLAKGLNRGKRGKLMSVKVWATCAKKLNAIKGANRNGKGWSKYWCDWKYRVRRHALEVKAAREANQTGPDTPTPLTDMEQTLIDIIGESTLEGIFIKNDPLTNDSSENEQNEAAENYETRPKRRKRKNSKDTPDSDDGIRDSRSTIEDKTKVENEVFQSGDDVEAAQFLELEKRKLQVALEQLEATKQISIALTRLADVLMQVKDVLVSNNTDVN